MMRYHIFFSGHVQGVYFRATCEEISRGLPVAGWVRNLSDGRVELCAEAERESLDVFVERIKEAKGQNISDLELTKSEATGEFDSFRIRYD